MEIEMRYVLGLDLGITSIGWAVYDIDKCLIDKCGVRLFDAAENPKDKSPLSAPRREARGQRRRIRRRAYRMQKIRELLINTNLIEQNILNNLFSAQEKLPSNSSSSRYDVYELRYMALDSLVSNQQLCQILIHLAKHRGFKSNRKKDKALDGTINKSLQDNQKILQDNGYRTIGEMLYKDDKFLANRRNRFGEYRVMLQRADIEAEAKLILTKQAELGNLCISSEFINQYIKVFNQQKSFDWNNDIIKMVGKCYFEPDELRAPKACFSSEKFIALSKINNIMIKGSNPVERKLSQEEIERIFNFSLNKKLKTIPKITFVDLRRILELRDDERFNFVKYKSDSDFLEQEKSEQIKELSLPATHELKNTIINTLGEITWSNLFNKTILLDQIAVDLTYNKTDEQIISALKITFNKYPNNFTPIEQQKIMDAIIENGIGFDKNISLSLKSLYKITPFLENGKRYDEACKEAGYNHSAQDHAKNIKLPSIQALGLDKELTNPVVTRAISQTRKVINAIIDKYGSPYQINIELARDVGKSSKQRNEISKRQKDNEEFNKNLVSKFVEYFGRSPIKDELLKFKLWEQQSGKCIYSGEPLNLSDIQYGLNLAQIDHIIPHSRSFNDSLLNKVLCLTLENQRKGNQTPFEYIGANGHNPDAWHKFTEFCHTLNKMNYLKGFSYAKCDLLLLKKIPEGFIDRNLNDTRYISRFILNYLQNHLKFADNNHKVPARVLTGQATSFIRSHWGLRKVREESDTHHAQDACVIAAITTSMQQKITQYMQAKSYGKNIDKTYTDPQTGEIFDSFPMPNINFRTNVLTKLNDVFVSRMPKHKTTGKIHDDTIRSRKYVDNPVAEYNNGKPFSTVNKRLSESGIKLDKNREIINLCPTYKHHNPNIYRLLVKRLEQNANDAKKAFLEPLFAPRKDGTPSENQIKTIKIIQAQNTGVCVSDGIADNGGMVRIDIFHKDGKNFIVPVYLSDVIKAELPNRAMVAYKHETEWRIIDSSYTFLYSFYAHDFIKITTKKEVIAGYYISANRATAAIQEIISHDKSKIYNGIGIQSAVIEKYQVDVLGNLTKVNNETRLSFNKG